MIFVMLGLMRNITNYSSDDYTDWMIEGNIAEVGLAIPFQIMGAWFIVLLFGFTFLMLYLKTRSLPMISIVTIFLAFPMTLILPSEFTTALYAILILSVAALIAGLFVKGRDF